VGVWQKLPPDLEAVYRQSHPWDDATAATARRFAATEAHTLWGDRPEVRIYPSTPVPPGAASAAAIALVAPGRGHDLYQLAVRPTRPTPPVALVFRAPQGPGPMPLDSLSILTTSPSRTTWTRSPGSATWFIEARRT
jgi:hypothetical protein